MNTAHKYDDQVIIPTIAGQLELLSGTDLNKELADMGVTGEVQGYATSAISLRLGP